ncbi:unnamed protein product [Clonostachys byssicola]|uniref:Uncharacterized protein n=1 Tax=Clonostachys byssicola TaxID=160290 RepID=A0A9N9UIH9_9HYPO|nr:unnamed protein product [Clonostachys byssicola]
MNNISSRVGSLFGVHVAVLVPIFVQVHRYRLSPRTATPSLPFACASITRAVSYTKYLHFLPIQGLQIERAYDRYSGCVELQHHDFVWIRGLYVFEPSSSSISVLLLAHLSWLGEPGPLATEEGWDGLTDLICFQSRVPGMSSPELAEDEVNPGFPVESA